MTVDLRRAKVGELRDLLVGTGEYSIAEAAAIKGKDNLVEAYLNVKHMESLDEVVPVEDNKGKDLLSEIPMSTDPEWNDYVMSKFVEDELVDGHPRIHGLRRVAQLLLGDIIESEPVDHQFINDGKFGRTIVKYRVKFEDNTVFSAVADAHTHNTDDKFTVFVTTVAETRAENRALRKALGLNTVSDEELTTKDTAMIVQAVEGFSTAVDSDKINDRQKQSIETLCKRLSIDTYRFINSGSGQYGTMEDVPYDTAQLMLKRLNDFQSGADTIPDSLKETK